MFPEPCFIAHFLKNDFEIVFEKKNDLEIVFLKNDFRINFLKNDFEIVLEKNDFEIVFVKTISKSFLKNKTILKSFLQTGMKIAFEKNRRSVFNKNDIEIVLHKNDFEIVFTNRDENRFWKNIPDQNRRSVWKSGAINGVNGINGEDSSRDDVASDVDSTPTWPSTTAHWAWCDKHGIYRADLTNSG